MFMKKLEFRFKFNMNVYIYFLLPSIFSNYRCYHVEILLFHQEIKPSGCLIGMDVHMDGYYLLLYQLITLKFDYLLTF